MPVLPVPRHELYAQKLAAGAKQLTAYREAGFAPNSKSAAKLAGQDHIRERINELLAEKAIECGVSIERVIRELVKIGFSNMLDYIKIDEEGQPCLDFTELERDKAAAIGEITTDVITSPRDGSVTRRTKFKLLDKKGALVDLGKHLGMFVDRKDIRVGGVMFHIDANDAKL